MIDAYLFDDHPVKLVPESLEYGDNWRQRLSGRWEAYQPEIPAWISDQLDPVRDPVLVDVGASTGVCSLLATIFSRLTVIAFEPNRTLVDILLRNLEANGLDNDRVEVYGVALDSERQERELRVPIHHSQFGLGIVGGTPLRAPMQPAGKVFTRRLDDASLHACTLIKIDVEGNELGVLRGGRKLLEAFHPSLVLEVDPRNTAQFSFTPDDVFAFLVELGYHYEWINKDNIVAWAT